jgi:hypothetical protein
MLTDAALLEDDGMGICLDIGDKFAAFFAYRDGFFESPDCRFGTLIDPSRVHG